MMRRQAFNQTFVTLDEHKRYLRRCLKSESSRILIFTSNGLSAGTVRVDFGPPNELSWNVASTSRGRGIGSQMVSYCAEKFPPVLARIRRENTRSIRVATNAGLVLSKDGEVMIYVSPEVSTGPALGAL